MASPLNAFTAEELTLLASVFGIVLAESMSVEEANLLASFLGTVASNMALYLSRKSGEDTPPLPTQ